MDQLNSRDVLDELGELFVRHGPPAHIRSDNGPEFIATALREWLERLQVKTLYIEPKTLNFDQPENWNTGKPLSLNIERPENFEYRGARNFEYRAAQKV